MQLPTVVDEDRHWPPMLAVVDSAGRARQRVLALFLPVAAALYISAEALNPPRHRSAGYLRPEPEAAGDVVSAQRSRPSGSASCRGGLE